MSTPPAPSAIHYLGRPGGRITFTNTGDGPLVILIPGMGDLRGTWRELVGPLAAAGYRVVTTDLRGHGDSDATFTDHGVTAIASDVTALIEHLGGPAVLIGNSVGAGAAAAVASSHPDLVTGLVMISPHVQDHGPLSAAMKLTLNLMLRGPWGPSAWRAYYTSLNKGTRAPWLREHSAAIRSSLREPGRMKQFSTLATTLATGFVDVGLPSITAPTLVLFGDHDPDFSDTTAELAWATTQIPSAAGAIVPSSGHYPQAQRPDVVVPAVLAHLSGLTRIGTAWSSPRGERA